ncbi:MAG TPA: PA14 domain-containing protein, partial [Planctomycetota bacterium]|nr:PA14 domain-containing protein [Planctomycetota bacterium]
MRRAEGVCGTRRRVPRNRPSKAVHIVTSRTAPSLLIVCALAMASPDRPFAAEATMATPPGLEVAGLERSELLLGQLGCASCHSAGAGEDRIFPRRGPVLGDVGARATRRYLEELIADPQSVKPGSPMPALFGSLDEDERQRTVSRIADFLLSRAKASLDRIEGDLEEIELGRRLYHSVGCVACHGPQETREALARPFELGATAASPEPVSGTVTLAGLARRISVPRLTEFLIDPSHIRPSGRMPALRLGDREARAIAVYLLREQFEAALATNAPAARAQGLRYRYFERGFSRVIEEIDGAKPKGQGIAPKFTIDLPRRNDRFGFEFSGLLRIERSGTYRFYLRSDDGSGLWIGDRLLINNDGDHAPTEKSETIDLEAGEHPIRVAYYENGGGEELRVQWEGPGVAREDIPSTALFHLAVPMVPLDLLASNAKSDGDDASSSAASETRAIDPLRVEEGAQHFSTLGCRSCHALEPGDRLAPPQAKPLADLDPDAE